MTKVAATSLYGWNASQKGRRCRTARTAVLVPTMGGLCRRRSSECSIGQYSGSQTASRSKVRKHDETKGIGDFIHPYRRADRAKPFSATLSVLLPGMQLSSGMGMV